MTPRASRPVALPLEDHASAGAETPEAFESALQHLIANYMKTEGPSAEPHVLNALQRLFACLSYELGRVDAAARLYGISRETTLRLLRDGMVEGKRVTLDHHEKGCTCQAMKVLEAELELN